MEKLNLTLEWKGPFGHVPGGSTPWFYEQAELKESPPGVYLQTLLIKDQYFVYYVGEAKDLLDRTRQHIAGFLSGNYWVYDPAATIKDQEKSKPYDPASKHYKGFLEQSSELRAMAYDWLAALQLFVWIDAKHELDDRGQKLVESALIQKVFGQRPEGPGWLCDNVKVSRRTKAGESVELKMKFPNGIQVAGLPKRIRYPEQSA